ncbi:hypothetical protein MBEHAL_0704 [Halarchaeum acidiphilum MH1-52-1]|uniref:Helix-hairpin-helix domain-containing protein n=2 Tax=Halarchaeum acidiphilum TaxID=489138 RepID=U3A2S5_9EURY|nr:helix-hairpin-helix domain-containing protein [Halarchaeum acidiphilum]GAD51944.1 hypothetical protein MBEHAL_0704 [Halarchaeum acidiphilum MH1-52-1]
MSLIAKLKTLLGMGSEGSSRGHDVATEENGGVEEPPAAETDAAASTESLVEESVEAGDPASPAEAAEPAEAAGPGESDVTTDVADLDPTEGEAVESEASEGAKAETETETETVDEPSATETDAAASTESLVDHAVEEAEPESVADAAEPAEAAGPSGEDMRTDVEDVEPDTTEDVADTEGAESVEIISGVGPAYADRLREAGVETVDDLANADVDDLAEEIDLSPKRIARWVEAASDRESET